MESKRRQPSVIARLMGLDPLPPQQPSEKQRKKLSENHLKRTSSTGFVEKISSRDGLSSRRKNKDAQEFKDVYEVSESSHAGKVSISSTRKETSNSKEMKIDYVRQKFMDAKRLSSNENLQHSKKLHDALDVLDSNKDVLLEFLQEPDFPFMEEICDRPGNPSPPEAGHITILKSSHGRNYDNNDMYWKSERKEWMDNAYSSKKYVRSVLSCSQNKHNDHTSRKMFRNRFERNNEASFLPSRIVVLKPNVGEMQNDETSYLSFPSYSEHLQPGYTKHRENRSFENRELFTERWDRSVSSRDFELLRHRANGSQEIAKGITRQMRSRGRISRSSKASSSKPEGYAGDESSCTVSVYDSADESEVLPPAPRHLHHGRRFYPSTFYSSESSVSREAKKRISERLKMTHGFQREGTVGRGHRGNTLGEMLALPDKATRSTSLESMVGQEGINGKCARNGVADWGTPFGISSRDGWKDECARSLSRSRSLPSSSVVNGSPRKVTRDYAYGSDRCSVRKDTVNWRSNKSRNLEQTPLEGVFPKRGIRSGNKKSDSLCHAGRDYNPTLHEVHPQTDESSIVEERNLLEIRPIHVSTWDGGLDVKIPVNDEIADMTETAEMSCVDPEMPEPSSYISPSKDGNFSSSGPDAPITERLSNEEAEEGSHTSNNSLNVPKSPRTCKETEQLSPVSVLEPQSVDEISPDPDCFESVSAGLQGLRMQLQLLKLESSDVYSDNTEMVVSSDEETDEERANDFASENRDLILSLGDESSRDFSYIMDVLVDSDFLDTSHDILITTWFSPNCPVGVSVFEKLEKIKYGELTDWSRSERKLLFDRINDGLIEILQKNEDPRRLINSTREIEGGWRKEPLEEELWKLLARQVKVGKEEESMEKVMGLRWLELGDNIDLVVRDIEKLVMEELMTEIIILSV